MANHLHLHGSQVRKGELDLTLHRVHAEALLTMSACVWQTELHRLLLDHRATQSA